MRTLLEFLVDTHGINPGAITQDFENAYAELKANEALDILDSLKDFFHLKPVVVDKDCTT